MVETVLTALIMKLATETLMDEVTAITIIHTTIRRKEMAVLITENYKNEHNI